MRVTKVMKRMGGESSMRVVKVEAVGNSQRIHNVTAGDRAV